MTTQETPLTPEPVAAEEAASGTAGNAAATAATESDAVAATAGATGVVSVAGSRPRRRRRLIVLGALVMSAVTVASAATYYLATKKPLPIPDIMATASNMPHYMYSIYGVDQPIGVAVTPDGDRLYVTESENEHAVVVLDASGTNLVTAIPPDSKPTDRMPVYDARDPLTGEIYVTDRLRAQVDVYDADGVFQREYVRPATLAVWRPLGVAFGADGSLYVSDVSGDNHRVYQIDRSGTVIRTISDVPALQYPNGIAVASDAVYVSDSNNGQLVRAIANQAPTVVVGRGIGSGDLSLPRGLALDDSGRLYVTDVLAHSVSIYQLPTEPGDRLVFLGAFGEEGRQEGQFMYPNGVAADTHGHLFVTDQGNNRIQVWGY